MKLFTYVALFWALLSTYSCQLARFDRLPGAELMEIPTTLQGTFEVKHPAAKMLAGAESFDLVIDPNNVTIKTNGSVTVKYPKQDFVLCSYDKWYVLGVSDQTIPDLWNIIILEPTESGINAYPLIDKTVLENMGGVANHFNPNMVMLQHQAIVPSPPNIGTPIAAAPAPNPHAGMPSNAKYYTMNEDQLKQYFMNDLLNKEFIVLKKEGVPASGSGGNNKKTKK